MNNEAVSQNIGSCNIALTNQLMRKHILDDELDKYTRLKYKINNLLWEELPSNTQIGQAEDIACDIFMAIKGEIDKSTE